MTRPDQAVGRAPAHSPLRDIRQGAAAGLVATVVMSLPMILGQWSDLIHRPPPEVVTQRVAARSGLWLEGRPLGLITIAAHLAFGATAGAFFTSATEVGRVRAHRATLGPLYGIAVWALAYLGALPRLGLIASQESVGRRRDLVMLVAHLVFGITLGGLTKGGASEGAASAVGRHD